MSSRHRATKGRGTLEVEKLEEAVARKLDELAIVQRNNESLRCAGLAC
jgi:hypothetical protein